jgi:hypothetical protein
VINIEKRPLHYRTWYKTNFDTLITIKNNKLLLSIYYLNNTTSVMVDYTDANIIYTAIKKIHLK